MKCIFIYNPNSGNGRILRYLDYIESEFKKAYSEVVMRGTTSREDMFNAVQEACNNFDILAFSGGDGTFNDIANVVCKEEKRPILAYIPAGTVNDLARNLKIPRNIKKAVKVITKGQITYHDAGMINNQYFVYVAGTGTFTSVSYETKQSVKKILGKLAYVLDGLEDIVQPKIVKVKIKTNDTHEEIEGEYPLLLVLNSKTCGGFPFNKGGHLNDGIFDIICVKKLYKMHTLNIFNLFIFGAHRKRLITNYYQMIRSGDFVIETDNENVWTIDGERGPGGTIAIKNLHKHLEIIVPMKHHKPVSKNFLPENNIIQIIRNQIEEQKRKNKKENKTE